MSLVTAHVSVSLDGFLAGPGQTLEDPIGQGGLRLHQWHFDADADGIEADVVARDDLLRQRGAYVMGRNMYGPVRGAWDEESKGAWRGWWGDEPPYHAPVFVLTHHQHEPIPMAAGTTFHFVTGGFDEALARAREVAGDLDVGVAGGASTIRQALTAGALDQLTLDVVPVLLGAGERLLEGVGDPTLEPFDVGHSPRATHIRYAVRR